MDNNVYINTDTFDIYDNCPGMFICDKKISQTIAILNKKGYKTLASCEGHNNSREAYVQENVDLDFLNEAQKDPNIIVTKINAKEFELLSFKRFAQIYIMFDNVKLLPSIPTGFKIHDNCLEYLVMYYDDDNNRYSNEYIDKELDKYNKILKEWAGKLPYIERKDDFK